MDGANKAWVGLVAGQFGARANVDILDWQFEHSQQTPTPTPTPSPTPTTTPIPTVVPGACSVVVNTDLALRFSPSRNSPRLATIPSETALTAKYRLNIGDSGEEVWYQVSYTLPTETVTGWIAASLQSGLAVYVDNTNCSLPPPYPDDPGGWPTIARIAPDEIPSGCDIDAYLRSEPPALVLARLAYGEAGTYKQTLDDLGDSSGGVAFSDVTHAAWIARLMAFLGYSNYNQGFAGRSTDITTQVLAPTAFQPITALKAALGSNGCVPESINDTLYPNVRRMIFPRNTTSAPNPGVVELYELWLIYQDVSANVINAPWTNMPSDLHSFDQFKGVATSSSCAVWAGGDGFSRPGSGYPWAANQPYPPKPIYTYSDPQYGGPGGAYQEFLTCYQDTLHLDDWLWAVGINQLTDPATNIFPREFCVVTLVNPSDPDDKYPLAQLRGLDGTAWPPGNPDNPNCTLPLP